MNGFSTWASDKRFQALVFLVLALAVVALGAYSYHTFKQSRYGMTGPNTISVSGTSEVFARPDIATFSFSVTAEAADPATAQAESAGAINAIMAYLTGEGIEERDIRTSGYYLSPRYEWIQAPCTPLGVCPPGRQNLAGYTVSQTIEVKVRDTAKAGDLIAGAGSRGATNVSGLSFTIDDEESLKAEAREAAIADAKEKADALARALGVRLVKLISFWEDQGAYPYGYMERAMSSDAGMGGAPVPSIPTGENTIRSNVTLIYEIR